MTAGEVITVTMSIGVAFSTDFLNSDVGELIHQADMALYAAKGAGRNCVRMANPGVALGVTVNPQSDVQLTK
jgi:diguanylate cyclase (GGDEF)-like protein